IDGLWRRELGDVAAVPETAPRLAFAIAGAQPVRDVVQFRFDLPVPGRAAIDVFDVSGPRVGSPAAASHPAGPNPGGWSVQSLPPGVYQARLSVGPRTETVRLVRSR